MGGRLPKGRGVEKRPDGRCPPGNDDGSTPMEGGKEEGRTDGRKEGRRASDSEDGWGGRRGSKATIGVA